MADTADLTAATDTQNGEDDRESQSSFFPDLPRLIDMCLEQPAQAIVDECFPPQRIAQLSPEERLQLGRDIARALAISSHRRTFKKTSTKNPEVVKFACSASGQPTVKSNGVFSTAITTSSKRCGCNHAWFTVGPQGVIFRLEHVDECKPLPEDKIQRRLFGLGIPAELEAEAIADIVPSLDSERIDDALAKDRMEKFLQDKGVANISKGVLGSILRKAKNVANKSMPATESMQQLLNQLAEERFPIGPSTRRVRTAGVT